MATPSPVTLLWGEDTYSLKAAEDALIAAIVDPAFQSLNLNVLEGPATTPSQVAAAAATMPFGLGGRLVLVRDCPFFSAGKGANSEDIQGLVDLVLKGLPPGCHLVFSVPGSIDKRLTQTKAILGKVDGREFGGAKPWEERGLAVNWLMSQARDQGIKLGNDVAEAMVDSLGIDRWKLSNELAKLATYANGTPISLDMLAVLGSPGETDVFAVLQPIGDRNAVEAVARMRKLLVTEAALRVLATMATLMRSWLQVRTMAERGLNADAIAQALGAKSSFKVKKDLESSRKFNSRQLQTALALLLETDVALKSGSGRQYEALQLERLLIRLAAAN